MLNSAQYFGTWSYTDSYYYSCSSSSYSLTACSTFSAPSSSCDSNDQVGLLCMTLPSTGIFRYCTIIIKYTKYEVLLKCTYLLVSELIILQNVAMELFDWSGDSHPMRADWNTVTMEHGHSFVIIIFVTKRL